MANKISNFSDLIQRVTISCLLNPLVQAQEPSDDTHHSLKPLKPQFQLPSSQESEDYDETQESGESGETPSSEKLQTKKTEQNSERMMESEALMTEMFDAVSDLKRAYVTLQQAHSPWDPVKMSMADAAMLKQFKRVGRLKERYKRMCRSGGGVKKLGIAKPLREAVAPYEETVKELKREVKEKEAEVEYLKEKLSSVSVSGKKAKFHQSKKKLGSNQVHVAPVPQLFEATMSQVKETSKSFTLLLLSLMRSAHWDLAAAVRSIESATNTTDDHDSNNLTMGSHHAKYALESYICSKIFHGFDHETFYIDGSLSSLLNPEQYRKDCFSQFRDMNSMDPTELLGILPTCQFGQFCSKKYLSIIHPKMEESLFGDLEQNRLVSAGNHPRSKFYGQFLKVAKAVWLLHLLAFSLDPSPCLFLATKGAEFQPEYMESVVRSSGRGMQVSQQIVGVPVSPGFKLGNGCIIKARVYLVPRK